MALSLFSAHQEVENSFCFVFLLPGCSLQARGLRGHELNPLNHEPKRILPPLTIISGTHPSREKGAAHPCCPLLVPFFQDILTMVTLRDGNGAAVDDKALPLALLPALL